MRHATETGPPQPAAPLPVAPPTVFHSNKGLFSQQRLLCVVLLLCPTIRCCLRVFCDRYRAAGVPFILARATFCWACWALRCCRLRYRCTGELLCGVIQTQTAGVLHRRYFFSHALAVPCFTWHWESVYWLTSFFYFFWANLRLALWILKGGGGGLPAVLTLVPILNLTRLLFSSAPDATPQWYLLNAIEADNGLLLLFPRLGDLGQLHSSLYESRAMLLCTVFFSSLSEDRNEYCTCT